MMKSGKYGEKSYKFGKFFYIKTATKNIKYF